MSRTTSTSSSPLARRALCAATLALAGCGVWLSVSGAFAAPAVTAPVRMSLPEARRAVHMMDDIYKVAVMNTHQMYVQDPGTPAAVIWAKQVLRSVNGKGWPEARILSSTDRPLNPENSPSDAFERDAIRAFQSGKTSYEQVQGGVLRYATDIRIADKKCIMCHVHNKEGDLVGGVSYRALLTTGPATPQK